MFKNKLTTTLMIALGLSVGATTVQSIMTQPQAQATATVFNPEYTTPRFAYHFDSSLSQADKQDFLDAIHYIESLGYGDYHEDKDLSEHSIVIVNHTNDEVNQISNSFAKAVTRFNVNYTGDDREFFTEIDMTNANELGRKQYGVTALHELGHTLELKHNNDKNSIMLGGTYPDTPKQFAPEDIAALNKFWGDPHFPMKLGERAQGRTELSWYYDNGNISYAKPSQPSNPNQPAKPTTPNKPETPSKPGKPADKSGKHDTKIFDHVKIMRIDNSNRAQVYNYNAAKHAMVPVAGKKFDLNSLWATDQTTTVGNTHYNRVSTNEWLSTRDGALK